MTDLTRISRTYYLGFNLPMHLFCVLGLLFLDYSLLLVIVSAILFYILIFGFGVNIGYHRLAAHRSFQLKYKWMRTPMLFLGLFSMMGGPIIWAQYHRWHHAHTDTDKDPHTPLKGKLYAHFLWTLNPLAVPAMVVKDLIRDRAAMFLNNNCRLLVLATLVIFLLIDVSLALGLMLAMIVSFNTEMSINSLFGHDNRGSKNTKYMQYVTLGASLHDNHHSDPANYNFAKQLGEVDLMKFVIDKIKQ